jgi:protein ImuA
VLLWSAAAGDTPLRRLQLAAQEGQSLAFLYRPPQSLPHALSASSPAAVRLVLRPAPDALRIQVLKARGGRDGASVLCPLRDAA